LSWRLDLAHPGAAGGSKLTISGDFDRWAPPAADGSRGSRIVLEGQRWPLCLDFGQMRWKTEMTAAATSLRRDGRWQHTGRASFLNFELSGLRLAGDRLRLNAASADWDFAVASDAWKLERFEFKSPLAALHAKGRLPAPPGSSTSLEGQLDLAGLAQQLPHALKLRQGLSLEQGSARVKLDATSEQGRRTWDVEARVSDLVARHGDRTITIKTPATLSARLDGGVDDLRVRRLALETPFLKATGQGDVDHGITIAATIDLAGLRRETADLIDYRNLDLAGTGTLSATYRRQATSFESRVTSDLNGLRIEGFGPIPLERNQLHLEVKLRGTVLDSGLPRSLIGASASLVSGETQGNFEIEKAQEATQVIVAWQSPVTLAQHHGVTKGRVVSRWDPKAISIDQLQLALEPDSRNSKQDAINLTAQGRFDRSSGELKLVPAKEQNGSQAIALSDDGLLIQGLGRADGNWRAEGQLVGDSAALSRALSGWSGKAPIGITGAWSVGIVTRGFTEGISVGVKLDAPGLSLPDAERGRSPFPLSLAFHGTYRPQSDRLDVEEMVVASRFATIEAAGRLEDLAGKRQAALSGMLTPDWAEINNWLARRVDPQTRLAGKPRAFRLKGPLAEVDSASGLEFEAGFDLLEADFYGMSLGPAPIVVRTKENKLAIDPIDTSLNGGRLHLEPRLDLEDERGPLVRLGKESAITSAEINDEVSRRVLSFVAPVLERATRARGRVSVDVRSAEFPLVRDVGRKAVVEGDVVFRDVEFAPGPLAKDLLDLVNRGSATVKLNKPVYLSIAEGRVNTHGLAIPVGNLTEIAVEGSVAFDRNIELVASLPIMPNMLADRPVLSDIAAGARISVPITGNLSKPKIDREAFGTAMKDLGKDLLIRGAARGALELLDRLSRPRDPDMAPPQPRLTPEERRARRQEKRATRRGQNDF
jgi:translocation and assembly module TamB